MRNIRVCLLLTLAALAGAAAVGAQQPAKASLILKTRMSLGGKQVKFSRKRFYLFRGGSDVNKALAERIKAAAYTSRDCFYCSQKASPEYMAWLQVADCESPYCREITADDTAKVPEFKAAYAKALTLYKNKPDLARTWLTTSMPPELRDGYYLQRKKATDGILSGVKPLATVMTDATSQQATFIDIFLTPGKESEKFFVSNVLPFESGGKAYTWICEVDVKPSSNILTLPPATASKSGSKCEVIAKDLPKCDSGGCKQ